MQQDDRTQRRYFIGGSDARIIMGSNEAALVRLWREKRGEAEPEDLSGNLIVQLGSATEELNRSWYERNTGRQVRDVQRRVRHSAIAWMVATLDGIVEGTEAVFESKFMLSGMPASTARRRMWYPSGRPSSSYSMGMLITKSTEVAALRRDHLARG